MTGEIQHNAIQDDSSPLSEARSSPGLLLGVLGSTVMRRLRETHTALNLKPRQFELLGLLDETKGLAQTALAERMGLAASALVVLLNPLEAGGRVTRQSLPDNRKHNLVAITPSGRSLLLDAARAQHNIDEQLMAPLTVAQRKQLAGLLKLIRDGNALHDQSGETPKWVGSAIP